MGGFFVSVYITLGREFMRLLILSFCMFIFSFAAHANESAFDKALVPEGYEITTPVREKAAMALLDIYKEYLRTIEEDGVYQSLELLSEFKRNEAKNNFLALDLTAEEITQRIIETNAKLGHGSDAAIKIAGLKNEGLTASLALVTKKNTGVNNYSFVYFYYEKPQWTFGGLSVKYPFGDDSSGFPDDITYLHKLPEAVAVNEASALKSVYFAVNTNGYDLELFMNDQSFLKTEGENNFGVTSLLRVPLKKTGNVLRYKASKNEHHNGSSFDNYRIRLYHQNFDKTRANLDVVGAGDTVFVLREKQQQEGEYSVPFSIDLKN